MWNLNNVNIEIILNNQKYRKGDINLFFEIPFDWSRRISVLWWNFKRKILLKSKNFLVKYQSLLQFSSIILTVDASKLYQSNPHC